MVRLFAFGRTENLIGLKLYHESDSGINSLNYNIENSEIVRTAIIPAEKMKDMLA